MVVGWTVRLEDEANQQIFTWWMINKVRGQPVCQLDVVTDGRRRCRGNRGGGGLIRVTDSGVLALSDQAVDGLLIPLPFICIIMF